MDLKIRYSRVFHAFAVPFGMGPRRSYVRIGDDSLNVAMGWGFRADIPLASVTGSALETDRVVGWGVHGWRGEWLVNGSTQGVVKLTIDPPVRARVFGANVRLRVLLVSVDDPDALISACVPATA
jgi:hypothetical protein